MVNKSTHHLARAATLLLLAVCATIGAWASTFTVTYDTSINKFVIERDDASRAETVSYRTVGITAVPGQHFIDVSGQLTFGVNETSRQVSVTEKASGDMNVLYRYQNGTKRSYRLEVLDLGGFLLDDCVREITYDYNYNFTNKYVHSEITNLLYFVNGSTASNYQNGERLHVFPNNSTYTFQVTDGGYAQAVYNIPLDNLFRQAYASQEYLNAIKNKVYASIVLSMHELNDGYQYIQVLTDNETECDPEDDNAKVSKPSKSIYKACFELNSTTTVESDYHLMMFPHRYDYATPSDEQSAGISISEFAYSKSKLYQQAFKSSSYRAPYSGSFVLDPTVSTLNVRFDAAGSGADTWEFTSLGADVAILDNSEPRLNTITVPYGYNARGNNFWVNIHFTEIVMVSGTPTLTTSWGTFTYESGSGSNVLTFSGTINPNGQVGSVFNITAINNASGITDMCGHAFQGLPGAWGINSLTIANDYTFNIGYDLAEGSFTGTPPTSFNYHSQLFTLPTPTRVGYNFAGWIGDGLTEPTINVTIPQYSHGDRYYTATWAPVTYTVSFLKNAEDATGEMAPQTLTYTQQEALNANQFERENYRFIHWNALADDSGTQYSNGQEVVNLANEQDANVNLYAQWTPVYSITYDLAGGSLYNNQTNPATYDVESAEITLINPRRQYYTFAGWVGTDLEGPTTTVKIPTGSTGDREYTATWTPVDYTITYDLNGGEMPNGVTNPGTYNIESESFTLNNPELTGYIFTGWTGTGVFSPQTEVIISTGNTGTRNYIANWQPIEYTITFDKNDDRATGSMNAKTFKYDQQDQLPQIGFDLNRYHFDHWNTQSDNSGDSYADQAPILNISTTNGDNITLYAQWTIDNVYSMTTDVTPPSIPDQTYCGSAITPELTLMHGNYSLVEGVDYTISSWSNNVNAGTATVVVAGKEYYTGTAEYTFLIQPRDIADEAVTITMTHSATYDGNQHQPVPEVRYNNATLVDGTDYTVVYNGGFVEQGTYNVTINGLGNFNGSVTLPFRIGESVPYIVASSGQVQTRYCEDYRFIDDQTTLLDDGWWVVPENVTVNERVTVSGTAYIILTDGTTFTPKKGISVNENNSVHIYAQSIGNDMGKVVIGSVDAYNAGIGGDDLHSHGLIFIWGGNIRVSGSVYGAGIGSGRQNVANTHSVGQIYIYNGSEVLAVGGHTAAGIGGGYNSDSGLIHLNGGNITAQGGTNGTGVGGGGGGNGYYIFLQGATLHAIGKNYSPAIGGGGGSSASSVGGTSGNIYLLRGVLTTSAGANANSAIGDAYNPRAYENGNQVLFSWEDADNDHYHIDYGGVKSQQVVFAKLFGTEEHHTMVTVNNHANLLQNVTIYPGDHTVTFDSNGGSVTPDTQAVRDGDTAWYPWNNITNGNLTLIDWLLDGEPYSWEAVTEDIQLVAHWDRLRTLGEVLAGESGTTYRIGNSLTTVAALIPDEYAVLTDGIDWVRVPLSESFNWWETGVTFEQIQGRLFIDNAGNPSFEPIFTYSCEDNVDYEIQKIKLSTITEEQLTQLESGQVVTFIGYYNANDQALRGHRVAPQGVSISLTFDHADEPAHGSRLEVTGMMSFKQAWDSDANGAPRRVPRTGNTAFQNLQLDVHSIEEIVMTDINEIVVDGGVVRYYDLSGRYLGTDLDKLQPGIYIDSNGNKIVK